MTDEERQKLCARLRAHEVVMWTDIDLAADEIERLAALVQSDTEPRCPRCGSHDPARHPAVQFEGEVQICPHPFHDSQSDVEPSLSDQMYGFLGAGFNSTTSDAEPLAKHPLGPDDKPMMDWYYDDEGVCRPSRAADRSGK